MKSSLTALFLGLCALAHAAGAADGREVVAMNDGGASTFYVDVHLQGVGATKFLVDTGSSYMTINEETLEVLERHEQVRYVKDLKGVLANGATQVVPVYVIKRMTIGEGCALNDVMAAVFPGRTRNILGLSALRTAAPFVFSVDPPTLELSNCGEGATVIAEGETGPDAATH